MSRSSATDTLKKLNPKNISGTIPQALDLIQQLKKVIGNPKMVDSVGASNLSAAMASVSSTFNTPDNPSLYDLLLALLAKVNINKLAADLNLQEHTVANAAKEILSLAVYQTILIISNEDMQAIASSIKSIPGSAFAHSIIDSIVADIIAIKAINV